MWQFRVHWLIPITVLARTDGIARFEEIRRGRRDLLRPGSELTERTHVVKHPKTAAVGADDEVIHIVVRVKDHVADRRAREIEPQRLPLIAVVEGNVDGRLGAGEEQTLLFGVFTNDMHLTAGAFTGREAICDASPGLAAVMGAVDVMLLGGLRSSWTK